MADNVEAASGSGGPIFATDEAAGPVHHPYVKVEFGDNDTQTKVAAASGQGLPVQGEAAENAAVTGNPVQAGGRYDATPRTLGDGDVGGIALAADGAVHIDDGGNAITVDQSTAANLNCTEANSAAIKTAVELIDDAISGAEMQVDIVAELPAGTQNIGDVDIASIAAGDNNIGNVDLASSIPAGSNNIGDVDVASCDGIAAEAAALGNGILIQGDDGTDRKNINVDATSGNLQVDVINTVTVGAHNVTNAGTFAVQVDNNPVLGAGSNNIGDVDIASALPSGSNNIGDVDVASIAAGDNNIGNVDVVTMPNVTLAAGTNTNEVVGDAAHDAAVAGNPLLIGAEARTSDGTAVGSGDAVRLMANTCGKLIVHPYALPENCTSGVSSALTTTTPGQVIAAPGASTYLYITSITVVNSDSTTGTLVTLQDGSGGTAMWYCYADVDGGGATVTFPTPIKLSANTALYAACGTATANVYVSATAYKATV